MVAVRLVEAHVIADPPHHNLSSESLPGMLSFYVILHQGRTNEASHPSDPSITTQQRI